MKVLVLFLITISVFTISCAKHEQESTSSQQVLKGEAETDLVRLVQGAIGSGDSEALAGHLKQVDVNTVFGENKTFLSVALESQRYAMVEFLLDAGASTELLNDDGDVLYSALKDFESDDFVTRLLKREPLGEPELLEILVSNGIKPLRVAVVEWVGTKSININQKVGRQPPPLILAVNQRATDEQKIYSLVEALLQFADVDVNITARGKTPLALARDKNYSSIAELLLAHGATE